MALGLDNYRVIPIEIDTANDVIFPIVLSCGDNDGRIIRVSVTDAGNPVQLDLTARLVYNPRPLSKESAGGYVTMTAVEGFDTATWEACIPGTSLVPGAALMAFQLADGDSILLSRTFECTCEPLIIHEDAPEVTSALSEFWSVVQDLTDMDEMAKEALAKVDAALESAEKEINEALTDAQKDLDTAIDEAKTSVETMITQSEIKVDEAIAKADQLIDDIEGNIEEAAQAAVDEALSHYTAITWEIDPDDQGLNCIYNYEEA